MNFGAQSQVILAARLATTTALASCTYTDASGVLPTTTLGARLTLNAAGALSIDGVATARDDVVLIAGEAAAKNRGVYIVANPGSATQAAVLVRHPQAQRSEDFAGMIVTTGPEGTANPSVVFVYSGTASPVIGTDDITYASQGNSNVAALAATHADPQFFAPLTTETVAPVATGDTIECFVNPAGTIAAMTLTLPTGAYKGQRLTANFTQIVTTLTVTNTNTDTKGLAQPTVTTATSAFEWVWDSASSKWNRIR